MMTTKLPLRRNRENVKTQELQFRAISRWKQKHVHLVTVNENSLKNPQNLLERIKNYLAMLINVESHNAV